MPVFETATPSTVRIKPQSQHPIVSFHALCVKERKGKRKKMAAEIERQRSKIGLNVKRTKLLFKFLTKCC